MVERIDSYKVRNADGVAFYVDVYQVCIEGDSILVKRSENKYTEEIFWEIQPEGDA